MGYLPLFLTFGGFILLFVMVVSSTFNNKKKRLLLLAEQALLVMNKIDNSITVQNSGNLQFVEQVIKSFQEKKDSLLSSNADTTEKSLIPTMKNLKMAKAGYNQLLAEKPYSFIGKLMGHQPLT
ncbi:hypothetical protein [Mongoliitalea lutea]|uniref:Uncharacterized protein n=1 Tax=Mongoliitalea lutea TaxID=849756 RepID=A0A8J3G3N8_9BACT|nr:hypothetical protein [Mongoliitalea lutea]GHB24729.1 hypothetical protein GCM10008106_01830 [Mongoliitalea lutea]